MFRKRKDASQRGPAEWFWISRDLYVRPLIWCYVPERLAFFVLVLFQYKAQTSIMRWSWSEGLGLELEF